MADDAKDESVLFLPEAAAGEGEMPSAEALGEGTAGGAGVAFLGAFASVLTSISQPTQYISPALPSHVARRQPHVSNKVWKKTGGLMDVH